MLQNLYTVFSFMRNHSTPPTDLSSGLGKEEDGAGVGPPLNACSGYGSDIIFSNVPPGGVTDLFWSQRGCMGWRFCLLLKWNLEGLLPSRFRFRQRPLLDSPFWLFINVEAELQAHSIWLILCDNILLNSFIFAEHSSVKMYVERSRTPELICSIP